MTHTHHDASSGSGDIAEVDPRTAADRIRSGEAILLDVREPDE